jgi:hypothetical protein
VHRRAAEVDRPETARVRSVWEPGRSSHEYFSYGQVADTIFIAVTFIL